MQPAVVSESRPQPEPGGPGGGQALAGAGDGPEPWEPLPADARLGRLSVRLAGEQHRETIYRLRHEVYARELGQHAVNDRGRLTDSLDTFNTYLVISAGTRLFGFVSITPPAGPSYSVDKYLPRAQLPFPVDDRLYEVRLLTIPFPARRSQLALALMYAAFRWVEAHGGTRLMAIGRREILGMYQRVGLRATGLAFRSGAVTYELMHAAMADIHSSFRDIGRMLERIEATLDWRIGVSFWTPAACYHGGEFFSAVGDSFETLERLDTIISADVLDAWFPPSPKAVAALQAHLPRLLHTSPPTGCEGLVRAIAGARGVKPESILPGAGSSDLIFLALRHWLTRGSRALILDPTYGEYPHVLEQVVGCLVDRWPLDRRTGYAVDLDSLGPRLASGYDFVVLVNPNSPTGRHVPRAELARFLAKVPPATRVWVDETYVDYAGAGESLETFAVGTPNVVVCKSMSKTYALSGARVAYLCASPHQLESLRAIAPPWAVSLPAQVAAVHALQDPEYYAARHRETHELRVQLQAELQSLGWDVLPSVTNFLLCHLPETGLDAPTIVARCRERGLFLRNAATMGSGFGDRAVRVAVKDTATNRRVVALLREVLAGSGSPIPPEPKPGA